MRRGRKRRRKRSATTTTTTTTTRKKGDTQREVSWAVEAIMKQWKGGREEGGKGGRRRNRRGHQTARCNSAERFSAKSGGGGANHRHKSMHLLGSGLGGPQQCPCNEE